MNRNKLINTFIGNISNVIAHEILKIAIDDETIRSRYIKESATSMKTALEYREKINPINSKLQEKDINYIRDKIIKRVTSKLLNRVDEGYKNINLDLIEIISDKCLKEAKII